MSRLHRLPTRHIARLDSKDGFNCQQNNDKREEAMQEIEIA